MSTRGFTLRWRSMMCPGERSSGSKRIPGSVTKRDNPRLHAAYGRNRPAHGPLPAELSSLAILAKGSLATGAVRKKAIVAAARRLAVGWRSYTRRSSRICFVYHAGPMLCD